MKHVLIAGIVVVSMSMFSVDTQAQDADMLRLGSERVVIVVEDGRIILRTSDDRGEADEREIRLGGEVNPHDVRIMRRRGMEGDTLRLDIERMVHRARQLSEIPREWFEGFELGDHPLGERLEERREVARMEAEARDLARRARAASGSERQQLETELRAQLDELLSRRLDLERERVDQLEERAEERRQRLEHRMANRGEMLERRFRDLMGSEDDLDW